jgi:hypothetical protein
MSPRAKRQLLQALHPHYRSAPKAEKTKILDAFTTATGYHRTYALSLLRHGPPPARPRRPGRVRYDAPVVDALRRLWEASGGLCSKRLHPFLGPLLETLARCGERQLPPRIQAALLRMSPATIDRKLAPSRRRLRPRGLSTTRPGSLLKAHIPIRTFAQWDEHRPGFTEMDLVAHCGASAHGEFVQTVSVVDIATSTSSRYVRLKRSMKALCVGLPCWMSCTAIWRARHQSVKACAVSSGPLWSRSAAGRP